MDILQLKNFDVIHDPNGEYQIETVDKKGCFIAGWVDPFDARMDIDIDERYVLSLAEWQSLWDWIGALKTQQDAALPVAKG